ncbi:MAG: glycosyltransferase family 4 protein [Thermoanaerobaculia bacterium]
MPPHSDPLFPPTLGVQLAGYLRSEIGTGELGRLLLAILDEAGIPTIPITFDETRARQQYRFPTALSALPRYPVNFVAVNADQVPVFARRVGEDFFAGRFNIGYWAWEVEEFPEWMAASAARFDEIWAISGHAAAAIARRVDRPVRAFPLAIDVEGHRRRERSDLGLPEGFLFVVCFDYDSVVERKNPLGAIRAYLRAFPSPARVSGPRLLVKSVNGEFHPDQVAELAQVIAGRSDIELVDGYRSRRAQLQLLASCDALISLHRAEGFGLSMGEAMALGKPVVATAYSGNLEFMTPETARLVPYELAAIPAGAGPYAGRWAEPDLDAAAIALRSLASDPQAARELGDRARRHVLAEHSLAARARKIADELSRLRPAAEARASAGRPPGDFTSERIRPYVAALLEHGPEVKAAKRGPTAALRRAVLRLARPLAEHQRKAGQALLDLVAAEHLECGAALAARDDELVRLEGRLRRLERRAADDRE